MTFKFKRIYVLAWGGEVRFFSFPVTGSRELRYRETLVNDFGNPFHIFDKVKTGNPYMTNEIRVYTRKDAKVR